MKKKNIKKIVASKNITYFVNEKKKTVTAVLKCDRDEVYDIYSSVFYKFAESTQSYAYPTYEDYIRKANKPSTTLLNTEYVGVARCGENDAFDEEYGKRLALARAKEKKADAISKKFFNYVDWLDGLVFRIGNRYDKLYRNWVDASTEVNDILKEAGAEK